ncbi:MAG: hypothetical protein DSY87_05490 [Methylococcus sp.]|nr:MAG: hypothetical protein DSY87_05490 [Methylococcus sp.]
MRRMETGRPIGIMNPSDPAEGQAYPVGPKTLDLCNRRYCIQGLMLISGKSILDGSCRQAGKILRVKVRNRFLGEGSQTEIFLLAQT